MFRGSLDPDFQRFASSSPTTKFEQSVEDVLEWLPFNPVSNWSTGGERKVQVSDVRTWFPSDDFAVFHGPKQDDRPPLTYSGLHRQMRQCPPYIRRHVVAVLLPPCMLSEMAVVLVSLMAQSTNLTVAPLDPNMSDDKLSSAILQLKCTALVSTKSCIDRFQSNVTLEPLAQFTDVRLVQSCDSAVGAVQWTCVRTDTGMGNDLPHDDDTEHSGVPPALLLRTSGTTATPKVVPLTRTNLLYNALCLSASLALTRKDIGCNAMPLYHIGGIACALLSVLVSGSSVVMMRGPFEATAFLDCLSDISSASAPTWYYGVPSMHKTLVLTAQARLRRVSDETSPMLVSVPNRLRFIRSGAAYLSPETALSLSKIFGGRPVLPTYSMSECMPVCSAHASPVVWKEENTEEELTDLAVGPSIGCSISIVDADGQALPYGSIGEVALKGLGVLQAYVGIPTEDSHTPDGWFRTGDMGKLDGSGNLTLTGRIKEMIKRGGEQIWPNEIDKVVEQVEGVALAVAFGVQNPLWGEEVAVAIVPSKNTNVCVDALKTDILAMCKLKLDTAAVPSQVIVVDSADRLPKSSTGKYLRSKMAFHLRVKPTDVAALTALEHLAAHSGTKNTEMELWASPSSALNGLRLIVACFVVQLHVGLYPNIVWLKVQSFSVNMQIFFMLGAFQLACNAKSSDLNWAHFVGTKIGAMHALFVITQLIALPSFLLFMCGPEGYYESFEGESCSEHLPGILVSFVFKTATGLFPIGLSNPPSWFQGAFYVFIMVFPWLNARLQAASAGHLRCVFAVNLLIATLAFVLVFSVPDLYILSFLAVSWFPALVSGTIAGYAFVRSDMARRASEGTISWRLRPSVWGWITDIVSFLFLLLEIAVILSPDCLMVQEKTFEAMRPNDVVPEDSHRYDGRVYVKACSITYDEFVDFVHSEEDSLNMGRWGTDLGDAIGFARLGTPLTLVWLYAMAHGRGVTARIMNMKVLQRLSHLAYPLYLLHVPVARFYWYMTRGPEAEHWWDEAAGFPIPVEWYETVLLILLCLGIGHALDRYIVQHFSKYTVRAGLSTCQFITRCCCCFSAMTEQTSTATCSLDRVKKLVCDLTGSTGVDRQTSLSELGLDSLGATALLGILQANLPEARALTLTRLLAMESVGALVDFLDSQDSSQATGDDAELDI